jgi:hypothetical protein
MDTIHEEDWSDFEERFKADVDGIDKYGRPSEITNECISKLVESVECLND